MDCTVETQVCQKHGVSGYPTLKIFRNGEVSEDYSGPREAGRFLNYVHGVGMILNQGPLELGKISTVSCSLGKCIDIHVNISILYLN